jgi:hypothetical protein
MLRTVEATIDVDGQVTLREAVALKAQSRALVTILDDAPELNEPAVLAESSLAEGWSGPEADEAWKHLADLPDLDEAKP